MKTIKMLFFVTALAVFTNANAQTLLTAQRWIKAGNSLREAGQYELSEKNLQRGFNAAHTLKNDYWEAVASEYFGLLYSTLSDKVSATQYFNNALRLYQSQNLSLSVKALRSIMSDKNIVTANSWVTYGGIEVGSRGIKFTIIKAQFSGGHFVFQNIKSGSRNTSVIEFTPQAIADTKEAVKNFFDTLQMYKEKIPVENIFIAVSSGVKQEADKKPGSEASLKTALIEAVPLYKREIGILNACQEAMLTVKGVVPKAELYSSSLIDVGSGNTKGGCWLFNPSSFKCLSIPLGTSTTTNKLPKNADSAVMFFRDSLSSIITSEINRNPEITNRSDVFFTGGIIWAVCNYMHPEKIKNDFTEFTQQDVETFLQKAQKSYDQLINPDLTSITDMSDFSMAQTMVTNTRSTFNQRNLIAGALLLRSILSELNATGVKNKQFAFARDGNVGWISGFIATKLDDEYKGLAD